MLKASKNFRGVLLSVCQGDLTNEKVDVIVNAANVHLSHGAGVAGAIVKKGGRTIQDQSDELVRKNGIVKTGDAAITGAGKLFCKFVIHAVGPVFKGNLNADSELLKKAVISSFLLAEKHFLKSISIPAISSGIFGFPKNACAEVMVKAAVEFIVKERSCIDEIRFVNFDSLTANIFQVELNKFIENEKLYLRFLTQDGRELVKELSQDVEDLSLDRIDRETSEEVKSRPISKTGNNLLKSEEELILIEKNSGTRSLQNPRSQKPENSVILGKTGISSTINSKGKKAGNPGNLNKKKCTCLVF
jgi:O-acetyl-ADP-ribose deacetylase (regulator of RNase III)